MSLPDLVRSLIAGPVVSLAGPFRVTISITPMTGRSTYGPTYGTPFSADALVENSSESIASADGTVKVSTAKFTFFEQLEIHEGDRITLNGVTTTVVKVAGLLDETGAPYLPEAWTGK
jgi:hypothetical protein